MEPGPVLVEETRDGRTQALHVGHAVLLDAGGRVQEVWGEDVATYWRSAPKALQAIPLARVMERFDLDQRALALACASHSGEPRHLAWVEAMLNAGGLGPQALQCGTHPPMTRHSVRPAEGQGLLHNNCSGKHAGMLLACVANAWPTDSYPAPDHPLQVEIRRLLAEATGKRDILWGTDGCGIPTFWLPVSDLARCYQWVARHDAGRHCVEAMVAHPWFVAGTDRFCTVLAEASGGDCVGKVGAAGVYVMLHRPSSQALAVKITGGDARAAETTAGAIAARAGWIDRDDERLQKFLARPVQSNTGRVLGHYEPRLKA